MKYIFNPEDSDEFILAKDFEDIFENLDLSKIMYSYGLLGYLSNFKITKKGLSCYDSKNNYVYFKKDSKYEFYKICFFYSESE